MLSHTVAVAEQNKELLQFLQWYVTYIWPVGKGAIFLQRSKWLAKINDRSQKGLNKRESDPLL